MSWQLQVLGTTSLSSETTTLHPERKTMGVLTYLALEGATHRSKLAGLLWPDSDEKTARNNLSQVLRRLKKTTEAMLILGEGDDILSLSGELVVDAAQLKVLAFAGDSSFLKLEGDLLVSHDYDDCPDFTDWLFAERERLQTLRQKALNELIHWGEKQGDYKKALRYAETRLRLDTLSEEAHRQVMRLHFLTGDRAAALKAFEKCKEILDKELGVEPSSETRSLAAEIEFGSLVPVATKAKSELPLRVLRPPLVGREELWSQMDEAWDKAQAIILRGEPGVGKSRLLRDFLDSKGAYLLFEGRPGDNGVPYSTGSRILRQVLNSYEQELRVWQRKELSRLLPELGETPEPLTSETDQLRFYEAQAAVFQSAFDQGMKVIAVDDLQFFDDASFKSLHFILGKHWGKPNALQSVLSYRRNELNADAEALLKDSVQGGSSILLGVNALDAAQVQTLIDSLGIANLEPLQKTLHSYTGGNPLFMLETIKSVLESESQTLKLPSSSKVQTLLQQRLEKLSQPALRLAWMAAVAQTDFSLELASHVTQQSPFELAEVLGELGGRGIFTGQRFSHDLIFETALSSIASPVKTYLHKQTAEFLEKQNANPANVANHYLAANEQNRALPFLQQAAETAKRDFQLVDAAVFIEQIATILEAQDKPDEAFDHLGKVREWLINSDQYEKVESIMGRMLKLAHTDAQRGESYFARAEYLTHQKGEFVLAEQAAREGLTHMPPLKQRALLLGALGDTLFFQNRLQESVTAQREAVKLNQELHSDSLPTSLANLALPLQYLGEYREALELQQQAIELLRQTSRHDQLSVNLSNYAITLCELGRLRESIVPLREALELQQKMQGVDLRIGTTFLLMAQLHRDLCHFADAFVAVTKAIELSEQSSDYVFSYFLANLAHIYLLLGQSKLAKEWLDKAVQDLPDYPTICARVFREQGRLRVEQGQHDQAKKSFEKAKHYLGQSQSTLILDSIHLLEAVIVSPKERLELAEKVLTHAKEGEVKGGLALSALTRCAQASLKLEQHKQALEYSNEAIDMLKTYDPDTFYLGEIYLTHYQTLNACEDKTAKDYLKQTLVWLMDIADNHVPIHYCESFLNNNSVNKQILDAARLEGLLESIPSV